MSIAEILFAPGLIVGILLLNVSCKLGIDIRNMCLSDHGTGTSSGEYVFFKIGAVIFYGIVFFIVYRKYSSRK
jgi:hypothetical protein